MPVRRERQKVLGRIKIRFKNGDFKIITQHKAQAAQRKFFIMDKALSRTLMGKSLVANFTSSAGKDVDWPVFLQSAVAGGARVVPG
jgi:hypothetical protein